MFDGLSIEFVRWILDRFSTHILFKKKMSPIFVSRGARKATTTQATDDGHTPTETGDHVQLLRSTFYVLKCDAIPKDDGKPIARNGINGKGGLTVAWAGDVQQAWSIAKRCAIMAEEIG